MLIKNKIPLSFLELSYVEIVQCDNYLARQKRSNRAKKGSWQWRFSSVQNIISSSLLLIICCTATEQNLHCCKYISMAVILFWIDCRAYNFVFARVTRFTHVTQLHARGSYRAEHCMWDSPPLDNDVVNRFLGEIMLFHTFWGQNCDAVMVIFQIMLFGSDTHFDNVKATHTPHRSFFLNLFLRILLELRELHHFCIVYF